MNNTSALMPKPQVNYVYDCLYFYPCNPYPLHFVSRSMFNVQLMTAVVAEAMNLLRFCFQFIISEKKYCLLYRSIISKCTTLKPTPILSVILSCFFIIVRRRAVCDEFFMAAKCRIHASLQYRSVLSFHVRRQVAATRRRRRNKMSLKLRTWTDPSPSVHLEDVRQLQL